MDSSSFGDVEVVPGFAEFGVTAFTTTRSMGSFALQSPELAEVVFGRWQRLAETFAPRVRRLVVAHQVHGDHVLVHHPGWEGWLRERDADGHYSERRGTAMAVSLADCVPVFIAHPRGATAIVHSGWRGTELSIVSRALETFRLSGLDSRECLVHCGPAICGKCYEVSPEVFTRLTGRHIDRPTPVDLRAIIAAQASTAGVAQVSISTSCTRCDNARFFSHRCGDSGRQIGVIAATIEA